MLCLEGLEKSREKPQDVPCRPETLDRRLPNERWSLKATWLLCTKSCSFLDGYVVRVLTGSVGPSSPAGCALLHLFRWGLVAFPRDAVWPRALPSRDPFRLVSLQGEGWSTLQGNVSNTCYWFNTRSAKAVNLTAADFWLSIILNPCIVLKRHV